MHFLKFLNHFRDEGLFYLEENSFNNLCLILNFMLTKSNEENDYECIKLCIILSLKKISLTGKIIESLQTN